MHRDIAGIPNRADWAMKITVVQFAIYAGNSLKKWKQ